MPANTNIAPLSILESLRTILLLNRGAAFMEVSEQDKRSIRFGRISKREDPQLLLFFFPPEDAFSYIRNTLAKGIADYPESADSLSVNLRQVYSRLCPSLPEFWDNLLAHLRICCGYSVAAQKHADSHKGALPDGISQIEDTFESSGNLQMLLNELFETDPTICDFWTNFHIGCDCAVPGDEAEHEANALVAIVLIWLATLPYVLDDGAKNPQQEFCELLASEIQKRFRPGGNTAPGDPQNPLDFPWNGVDEIMNSQDDKDYRDLYREHNLITYTEDNNYSIVDAEIFHKYVKFVEIDLCGQNSFLSRQDLENILSENHNIDFSKKYTKIRE